MKTKLLLPLAALALSLVCANAQTTNTPPSPPTTPPWLENIELGATNWAVIPFASYQIEAKKWGGGGALLYMASPYLWTGFRIQSVGNIQTTAAVQGQLQATIKVLGLNVTPFVESAVGLGKSSLYANAGTGALIGLHQWKLGTSTQLGISLVADYEHYVSDRDVGPVAGPGSKDGNQVNAGVVLHLTFP